MEKERQEDKDRHKFFTCDEPLDTSAATSSSGATNSPAKLGLQGPPRPAFANSPRKISSQALFRLQIRWSPNPNQLVGSAYPVLMISETLDQPDGVAVPDDTQAALTAFKDYLLTPWNRQKTPRGFDNALRKAKVAEPTSTERIFYDTGFQCFLAYFLATVSKTEHYPGKHAKAIAIATFDNLPGEQKRSAAHELAKVLPHPSVEEQINQLSRRPGPSESAKHRRTATTAKMSRPRQDPSASDMHNGPSTESTEAEQPSRGFLNGASNPGLPSQNLNGPHLYSNTSRWIELQAGRPEQDCVANPPTVRLARNVRPYMCTAIAKDGDRALISMVFPYYSNRIFACLITLVILPNKIEYTAMQLFDVHVETGDGCRYVVLEDGTTLHPNPELTIRSGRTEGITKLLGPQWTDAIRSSPTYGEETRQGSSKTRCVSMTISDKPDAPAALSLNTGPDESFELKESLFG